MYILDLSLKLLIYEHYKIRNEIIYKYIQIFFSKIL